MGATAGKQEALWRSDFGDDYIGRNAVSDAHLAALTRNWARVLAVLDGDPPKTIFEGGANIGLNLRALRRLTDARFIAMEPNAAARDRLVSDGVVAAEDAVDGVLAKIPLPDGAADLAFTSGVLIHVNPDDLAASCREIARVARRYVIALEYFSDKPETIPYRGQTDALFKRDFGGFYLDTVPGLKVLDYGFAWKRLTGLDNLTWWVFRKEA